MVCKAWRLDIVTSTMTSTRRLRYLMPIGVLLLAVPLTGAGSKVRIVQTNSAGDSVSLIDPATNKVVGEIKDIEVNHGAAAAPDGSHLYISNEAESSLDVVDAKTLKVTKRIPLSGHPNNLSISRDGRRVSRALAPRICSRTSGGRSNRPPRELPSPARVDGPATRCSSSPGPGI